MSKALGLRAAEAALGSTLRIIEGRWFSAARASGLTKLRTTPVGPSYSVAVFPCLEVLSTHSMKASVRISRGVESLFGTRDENIRLLNPD